MKKHVVLFFFFFFFFSHGHELTSSVFFGSGAIEPQFYALFIKGMGLDTSTLPDQNDISEWPSMKQVFAKQFLTKTRDEWCAIFDGTDACVAPVLEWEEVMSVQHNKDRKLLIPGKNTNVDKSEVAEDEWEPRPAPRLSRTPGRHVKYVEKSDPEVGEHTVEVLKEYGISEGEIKSLEAGGVILDNSSAGVKAKL
jgi:alpha-methylacyl-CoA racemase